MKACISCGGTGWWLINKSWFSADGYRRIRCHICSGSGQSSYNCDVQFVKEQASRREAHGAAS